MLRVGKMTKSEIKWQPQRNSSLQEREKSDYHASQHYRCHRPGRGNRHNWREYNSTKLLSTLIRTQKAFRNDYNFSIRVGSKVPYLLNNQTSKSRIPPLTIRQKLGLNLICRVSWNDFVILTILKGLNVTNSFLIMCISVSCLQTVSAN